MPNWCWNTVTISGSGLDEVRQKIKGFEKNDVIFEGLIGRDPAPPIPENPLQTKTPGLFPEWYNHNMQRYGTKWDVKFENCNYSESDDETTITLCFDTAWGPPVSFCETLRDQYGVKVTCRYSEQGFDFYGENTYPEDGNDNEEDYTYYEGLYHFEEEQFWDDVQEAMSDYEDYGEFMDMFTFLSEEEKSRIQDMWNAKDAKDA